MDSLLTRLAPTEQKTSSTPFWRVPGRIAYIVNHSYPFSSNGYAVRTQGVAQALVEHGHSVVAITRPGRPWDLPGFDGTNFDASHEIEGVRYLHLKEPSIKNNSQAEYLTQAVVTLKEHFQLFKPSVVMAASNWENALPAAIAARELGLPFFYEVRGFWEITRASIEPAWQESDEFHFQVKMETTVAKQADRVFTLNRFMREELVKRGVDEAKIDLVPNGYGKLPDLSKPTKLTKADFGCSARYVVGYVGSFTEYEGLDDLVKACSQIRKRGVDLSLLLVGSSSPVGTRQLSKSCKFSSQLKDLAKKSNFNDYLHFAGHVSSEKLRDYYALIDLIVIPRKTLPISELVSPIKPFEAAAFGKAMLLSNIAPLKEIAEASGARLFKHSKHEQHLKDSIANLLDDTEKLKRQGEKAHDWILGQRTFSRLVEPITQLAVQPKRNLTKRADTQEEGLEAIQDNQLEELNNSLSSQKNISKNILIKSNEPVEITTFKNSRESLLDIFVQTTYLFEGAKNRKAILRIQFIDKNGKKLSEINELGFSAVLDSHYTYLNNSPKKLHLVIPANVALIKLQYAGFKLSNTEQVNCDFDITYKPKLSLAELKNSFSFDFVDKINPILSSKDEIRKTSDLNVAIILDEFTTECLIHEFNTVAVTQEGWLNELEKQPIDFLLVESCWKGNNNNWGTLSKGSGGARKLGKLMKYCKEKEIPTIFWNKEDPPHYEKFAPVAAACFDFIFTTDATMVPRYKDDFGIDVYPLSFAAQPKIHNPSEGLERREKVVFAGSYYSDKPERCADFNSMMSKLEDVNLAYDIYDRNHNSGQEKFFFPEKYQSSIVGKLAPSEMWKANKGYKYQLNMNTVKHSPTMFARRVYESLASGTPVISNYSLGVSQLFNGIVLIDGGSFNLVEKLNELESDTAEYNEIVRTGVREVMRFHTYSHRIKTMCDVIGIPVRVDVPQITMVVYAKSDSDIARAIDVYNKQTATNKKLFIALDNFEGSYKYLNSSDEEITYAMHLSKGLYSSESDYFNSTLFKVVDLDSNISAEYMEDALYWGSI